MDEFTLNKILTCKVCARLERACGRHYMYGIKKTKLLPFELDAAMSELCYLLNQALKGVRHGNRKE